MESAQVKEKILDKTNDICYQRYGISLYEICDLQENDAGYIKEILLSGAISTIKAMGVAMFISSIPFLSQSLISHQLRGNKDRALRQLFDNTIVVKLLDKIDSLINQESDINDESIENISQKVADEAIRLANF